MNVLVPACSRAWCGVDADGVQSWCGPGAVPELQYCLHTSVLVCTDSATCCPSLSNMPDQAVVVRKSSQGGIDNRQFQKRRQISLFFLH